MADLTKGFFENGAFTGDVQVLSGIRVQPPNQFVFTYQTLSFKEGKLIHVRVGQLNEPPQTEPAANIS